jgi:hypothetical protein
MKEWFENKTVALIGNSMSLFDSDYGKEIDSHEVVVRLNKAAMLVDRFDCEKSHGTRTDIWGFWNVLEYNKYFSKYPDLKKMHAGHQFRLNDLIRKADFVYPNELYKPLKEVSGSRRNPTTGFIMIDYIMHCKPAKMNVYGFDFKKTPTWTDPDRIKEKGCPHNYDVEEQYCMELVFSKPNAFLRYNK